MPIFLSEKLNTNTDNNIVNNAINLGDPSEDVDSIYFVGKNITGATLSGGMGLGLNFPEPYHDGYQYWFQDSISRLTGGIILNITGAGAEITKVYLMKKLFEFPDDDTFIRMDMSGRERNAIIQEDLYGDISKIEGKIKRRVSYTAERQDKEQERLFELFRENNTHFMFLEDFIFYPHRIYNAILGRNVETQYSILNKHEGVNINFDVSER